jgi:hypothetical protein
MLILVFLWSFCWLSETCHCDATRYGLSLVDIAVSASRSHFTSMWVAVVSAIAGCQQPQRLRINIIVSINDSAIVARELEALHARRCALLDKARLRVVTYDETDTLLKLLVAQDHALSLPQYAVGKLQPSNGSSLASASNYARLLLPHLLPDVDKVIFLDCDIVVFGDLICLFERSLRDPPAAVAAFARRPRRVPLEHFFHLSAPLRTRHEMGDWSINWTEDAFNAGVAVLSLAAWRRLRLDERLVALTTVNFGTRENPVAAAQRIWDYGTQPLWLLLFHGMHEWFGAEWNWPSHIAPTTQSPLCILHFNGVRSKPWNTDFFGWSVAREQWQRWRARLLQHC